MLLDDLKAMQTGRETLQRLSERKRELLERISAPTSVGLAAVHVKTDPRDLSDDFARIDAVEREYEKALGAYYILWERCKDGLDALDVTKRAAVILSYRYILGWTWKKISDRMELTAEQLHNIHNKAFEEIAEKERIRSL